MTPPEPESAEANPTPATLEQYHPHPCRVDAAPTSTPPTRDAVELWLLSRASSLLEVPSAWIHPDRPLAEAGLSSIQAGELSAAIEDAYGITVGPTFVYDHATPTAMAEEIVERVAAH